MCVNRGKKEAGSCLGLLAYRMIDSPHEDAQKWLGGSEELHFLADEMLLLRLRLGCAESA